MIESGEPFGHLAEPSGGSTLRPRGPAARRPGGRASWHPGGRASRPWQHRGGSGCWSRPHLTASWPSLLLSATGFNSNVALPHAVLTATGKALLLSERTADSNREGHDAHAAQAAPWRGTAHVRLYPAPDSPRSRVTRQPLIRRPPSVIKKRSRAAVITAGRRQPARGRPTGNSSSSGPVRFTACRFTPLPQTCRATYRELALIRDNYCGATDSRNARTWSCTGFWSNSGAA